MTDSNETDVESIGSILWQEMPEDAKDQIRDGDGS